MPSLRHRFPAKSPKPVFNANQYAKLKTLFEQQHWDINEELEISYFERYVRTLSSLQEDQQDFLIGLTGRFLHLPQTQYLKHLVGLVKKLRADHPDENLIFACSLPKEDVGKPKSSTTVLYQFKGSTIHTQVDLGKYYIVEKFTSEFVQATNLRKSHFVLVDDFIGTGETALGAIDYIHELFPALTDNSKISILSIVAMHQGKQAIENTGTTVYASIICNRGIADNYTGAALTDAKNIMTAIEQTLKGLKPQFHFGYGHSEALVCMERCPNNTFPIYWYTPKDAPYERK